MRRELLKSVDIVIPVYNAFESLTLCIDSIRKHTNLRLHRVIIINDCSPDKRIKPYLDKLGEEGFIIIHNEKNQGFSANVNIGMSYSDKNDVILLNSDTIVTKRWVEKLVECAYASKETGTVTPLSNSATIASVPVPFVDNPLPKGMSVDEFAELVEHCSFCEYPRITVAVGFCMYIKREVIEKVEQEIFDTGNAVTKSEIGSYWWKEFQTAFHNAYGDRFETQRKLEFDSLEKTIQHFRSTADAEALSSLMFEYWVKPPVFEESKQFFDRCPVPVIFISSLVISINVNAEKPSATDKINNINDINIDNIFKNIISKY